MTLGRAERRILAVLARDGERDTRQIALLTGYSTKGGGFRNALSRLRTAGYVTGHGRLQITLEGRAAAGEVEVLPTGADLLRWWQGQLHKAEREVLGALAARYPHPMTVQEIADATGYSAVGGGFRNALSKLRTLGLIDGRGDVRLDPTLTST